MALPKQKEKEPHEEIIATPIDERGLLPFEFDSLEVRADEATGSKLIRGHGAVYNKLSVDLGGFQELFLSGSLTDTIQKDDIRSLRDHIPSYILGRNRAKTLKLEEDEKGIYYEVTPPDTSYARDLMVSIERRDVTGGSIIFQVDGKKNERWFVDGEEVEMLDAFMAMWDGKKHKIERHIVKARLYDIGPVTFPAYPQTDVKVRSMMAMAKEKLNIPAADKLDVEGALNGRALSLARKRLNYGYPRK
jgi:HK97 family phage prohead protease